LKEVIDIRFLREYFYSSQTESREKAVRKFNSMVRQNEGILPTIVIAEITQITCALRGKDMAQNRYQALIQSGLIIQDLTSDIAQQAGFLKCTNEKFTDGRLHNRSNSVPKLCESALR
jgi:hypothetical protein